MYDLTNKTDNELWELLGGVDANYKAEALREIGHRKAADGFYGEAEQFITSSIQAWIELQNTLEQGRCWYSLGHAFACVGNYLGASDAFESAANCYQLEGRYQWQADAVFQLAVALAEMQDLQGALAHYELSASIFESEGIATGVANSLQNQGEILGFQGKQSQALSVFEIAKAKFIEDDATYQVAKVLDRIAAALIDLGRYTDAVEALEQARATFAYLEQQEELLHATQRLAEGYMYLEKYQDAKELFEGVSAKFKESGEPIKASSCDLYLAECLGELEQFDRAETLMSQLEGFFRSAGIPRNLGKLTLIRGNLGRKKNQPEMALKFFSEVIEFAENNLDSFLLLLGRLNLAEEMLKLQLFDDALALVAGISDEDTGERISIQARLGIARATVSAASGCPLEAEKQILETIELLQDSQLSEVLSGAYVILAELRRLEGRVEDSELLLLKAERIWH